MYGGEPRSATTNGINAEPAQLRQKGQNRTTK